MSVSAEQHHQFVYGSTSLMPFVPYFCHTMHGTVSILVKLGNLGNANGNITTPNFQHVTKRPQLMPWRERFTTPLA
jgi:hypothetical protein